MSGCKECPAFAKCTVAYRGSACAALRWTYGLEDDPEIITNADRIRDMTDEELARFLVDISGDCTSLCECCAHARRCTDKCIGGVREWLRQPVKED